MWVWIVFGVVVAALFYFGGRSLFRVDKGEYDLMSRGGFMGFRRYRDEPPKDD